jgi:class 3 adenylate cyclase/tetratricopeptide (TPR) repeat protein
MICASCGTENRAGRKFCSECAAPLAVTCPACGTSNEPGEKFCGECAAPLAEADRPGAGPGPAATPAGNGPLRARGTVVAERRLVSVLFADLVGFTPFAEERDAEEVRETLSRYFELARDTIDRYGGTVEKFIGDAVMAVWGAPTAQEDDAERAVRAALELVDAVRAIGPGITARVGVLTGEAAVTLGATGEGMVAGDLVNTASRLQSVAPPGTVLVGEPTMRAASAAIAFEPAGEQTLKGKAAPIPAWRALRAVSGRGGRGRSDLPEPPFVGRDSEIRLLKDLLHEVGRDRRTRLVSVTGPAGIGKSRLAEELEKYLDGIVEAVYWHRGRSPAYGEGITFWALGEMVRARAGLAETDDDATTRTRIAATVADYVAADEDRRWVEPALLTLLGIGEPPPGGRDRLFAAWRVFFEAIAARGVTVLLFEDLHWADSGLLDFIDHLVDWSKGVPILVLTLARPELFDRRPGWGAGHRGQTSLALEPLSPAAMTELLASLVPGLPDPAVRTILERAAGVPLYAVETVRMLLAEGRLERDPDGRFRPTRDFGTLAVPESLRSLIASRLDGLEPADRSLLQDAAVLGQSFTADALTAVAGGDLGSVEARLRGLVRRELLDVVADPRSPERGQYVFVQSMVREVAYGTLSRRDRREKHLAVARRYESLGDEELAGALAAHYLAAHAASAAGAEADSVAVQARIALRAAAERASALGGHEQALVHLEQALAISTEAAERAPLLERAAFEANAAGRYEVAIELGRSAAAGYRGVADEAGAGRATALLAGILVDAGQIAAAAELLEAAIPDLPEDAAGATRARLLAHLSRAYMRLGMNDRAIETADGALLVAEPEAMLEVVVEAFINKGSALSNVGRWREGAAILAAAVDLADELGAIRVGLRARNNLGAVLFSDDVARSVGIGLDALELARRVGDRNMTNWLVGATASGILVLGRGWDESLARIAEALDGASDSDRVNLLGTGVDYWFARGRVPTEDVAEYRRLAGLVSDPGAAATTIGIEGQEAWLRGDLRAAAEAFLRAGEVPSQSVVKYLFWAARLALWCGDVDLARRAAEALETDRSAGRMTRGPRLAVRAIVDALEGRQAAALDGFRRAIDEVRAAHADFVDAGIILDARIALPEEPAIVPWLDEARAVFERIGARLYLDRLAIQMPTGTSAPATAAGVPAMRSSTMASGVPETAEVE